MNRADVSGVYQAITSRTPAALSATGTLTKSVNQTSVFSNNTAIDIQSGGSLVLDGTVELDLTGSGGIDVASGGTIQLTNSSGGAGNPVLDMSGGALDNSGTLQVDTGAGGGTRTINGEINNSGSFDVNHSVTVAMGAADFDNLSGGSIDVESSDTLQFTGSSTAADAIDFQSGGTVTVNSSAVLDTNGLDTTNDGMMTIDGTMQTEGGDITNNGTMDIDGGVYLGDGPGGTTNGGVGATFFNPGTITGSGVIELEGGTFDGTGGSSTITPGASPGELVIDGNTIFGASSTTEIELAGTQSVTEHDVLSVTGAFTLAGTLSVLPYDDFAAQDGDEFDIITWGSRSGMFHEMEGLDTWDGVALDPIVGDSGLTLVARAVTADGDDGADVFNGSLTDDVITGRGGDDILIGQMGDDALFGGDGADTFSGGMGDDRIVGGLGEDTADYTGASSAITVNLYSGSAMDGDGGVDTLISIENVIGSAHADVITGNARDNVIIGGEGADVLIGGDGADQFVFGGLSETGDLIEDFLSGTDTIVLDANAFALTSGEVIEGENFSIITDAFDGTNAGNNTAFASGDAALIYSEADAALYYDSNGASEGGYSVVATFSSGTRVDDDDVQVVHTSVI